MPSWPDEAVEPLRIKWAAGKSASQCAAELREELGLDVSRNAVIGKVHRLGLPPHPTAVAHSIARNARRQRQVISEDAKRARKIVTQLKHTSQPNYAALPALTTLDAEHVVYYKSIPFFELESHHCRFAVSGDNGRDYQFCGNVRWQGSSYCAEHTRLAYTYSRGAREHFSFMQRKKAPVRNMLNSITEREKDETP